MRTYILQKHSVKKAVIVLGRSMLVARVLDVYQQRCDTFMMKIFKSRFLFTYHDAVATYTNTYVLVAVKSYLYVRCIERKGGHM